MHSTNGWTLPLLACLLIGCGADRDDTNAPPLATKDPVVDGYHGVSVTDDYRWLEDGTAPEVRSWSAGQDAHARAHLAGLPAMDAVRERIAALLGAEHATYYDARSRPGKLFVIRRQPPSPQPVLLVLAPDGAPNSARVLVDPTRIDPNGATTIDWYVPSPDGSVVAVSLSSRGTETGDLHLYDTATGRALGEMIPRVEAGTAGGDVAWTRDGTGFYYTRYPRAGERSPQDEPFFQQVWFHELRQSPGSDRYELGREFERIAETRLETDPVSGRVLATVQSGDSGRFALHLRDADGTWTRIADLEDGIVQATFSPAGDLFLVSRGGTPNGSVLRLPAGKRSLTEARVVVPESGDAIVTDFYKHPTMVATRTRLFLTYQLGGPSEIRAFDHDGRPQAAPEQPAVSSVGQIEPIGAADEVLFRVSSYLAPSAYHRFDAETGKTSRPVLAAGSAADFSDTEVVRETATSIDGTRIPVNILRRKGTRLDGSNPVLLTGYGGFGLSRTPGFRASRRVWVEQGGVYAVANIRGGGEYGRKWHDDGRLLNKQNGFDDFAAAMRHLIDAGYTTPDRLAIVGGSNGGLLMGAMVTQHPDLFRATVSSAGIYDMLRVERSPNGAFNVPEYGTVREPESFDALYGYSPYHRVRDGLAYPAVLFMMGENDARVDPMQSRKMTARLRAATTSGRPVLLRINSETGHGSGTPLAETIEQIAASYAFLFDEAGVEYRAVSAVSR